MISVDVAANLASILARIEAARKAAVRPAPATHLIAVTKMHERDRILPALQAGQREFGENRVQEAKAKWPALRAEFPAVRLHLIGPLQTNKVNEAVALFDAIHSLDRLRLAEALATEMERTGKRPELFVEVNTGEEAQKGRAAARHGRLRARLPRAVGAARGRADVHSAGRRGTRAAFRAVAEARARMPFPIFRWA